MTALVITGIVFGPSAAFVAFLVVGGAYYDRVHPRLVARRKRRDAKEGR